VNFSGSVGEMLARRIFLHKLESSRPRVHGSYPGSRINVSMHPVLHPAGF
jgi:hypothetical protein